MFLDVKKKGMVRGKGGGWGEGEGGGGGVQQFHYSFHTIDKSHSHCCRQVIMLQQMYLGRES